MHSTYSTLYDKNVYIKNYTHIKYMLMYTYLCIHCLYLGISKYKEEKRNLQTQIV